MAFRSARCPPTPRPHGATREKHCLVPSPDRSGDSVSAAMKSSSGNAAKVSSSSRPIRQPLGEIAQRVDFPPRQTGGAELDRLDGEQLGGRRRWPSNIVSIRPIVRRVAATESCWPLPGTAPLRTSPSVGALRARRAGRVGSRSMIAREPDPPCVGERARPLQPSLVRRVTDVGAVLEFGHPRRGIRTKFWWLASGPPAWCSAPPVTRLRHRSEEAAVSNSCVDRALASASSPETKSTRRPPASCGSAPKSSAKRVGGLHDTSARKPARPRSRSTSAHQGAAARGWGTTPRCRIHHDLARPDRGRPAFRGHSAHGTASRRSNSAPPRWSFPRHPGASASTTDANDSGPRLFAITTGGRPAAP